MSAETTPTQAAAEVATTTTAVWRPLTPGLSVLAGTVAVISILTGLVLIGPSLAGHAFGAWTSPSPVTQGLLGAAMLGVAPGLLEVGRARTWQEARTLVWPLATVVVGMFVLCLVDHRELQIMHGGPILAVFFSLGWVGVFAVLSLCVLGCVARQLAWPAQEDGDAASPEPPTSTEPRTSTGPARVALPGWTKPALAILGSSWFGIGAGLVLRPGFWSAFVPWSVTRLDAQALGIWAGALGVGVLGTLAEDDLARVRPALRSSGATALALGLVLAAHPGGVHWTGGPAFSLLRMVAGLLVSSVAGHRILAAASSH
ncbi:hypothetical protein KDL01_30530 [Actinospica durhamensis]|uniref:Uncharacterized protein n=1 Tax=Actinospica durhamensis TaxID=1508375 RepID=A0A941IVR7_9ACTN|nr:hypothetical protein [Actinospica durhamensis]MBR7837656.1 hypothetical protein [Actinospica durhamensis]